MKPLKGKKAADGTQSSTWETVCTTLAEVKAWAKRLKTCKGKPEAALFSHVTTEMIPSLEETETAREFSTSPAYYHA